MSEKELLKHINDRADYWIDLYNKTPLNDRNESTSDFAKGSYLAYLELNTTLNMNQNKKESYDSIGWDVGQLVQAKQNAYGDSFGRSGECLRQMFPNGIQLNQYDDLLTIARILDKLFRIANDPKAFSENPWQDIVGYGLLAMKRYDEKDD